MSSSLRKNLFAYFTTLKTMEAKFAKKEMDQKLTNALSIVIGQVPKLGRVSSDPKQNEKNFTAMFPSLYYFKNTLVKPIPTKAVDMGGFRSDSLKFSFCMNLIASSDQLDGFFAAHFGLAACEIIKQNFKFISDYQTHNGGSLWKLFLGENKSDYGNLVSLKNLLSKSELDEFATAHGICEELICDLSSDFGTLFDEIFLVMTEIVAKIFLRQQCAEETDKVPLTKEEEAVLVYVLFFFVHANASFCRKSYRSETGLALVQSLIDNGIVEKMLPDLFGKTKASKVQKDKVQKDKKQKAKELPPLNDFGQFPTLERRVVASIPMVIDNTKGAILLDEAAITVNKQVVAPAAVKEVVVEESEDDDEGTPIVLSKPVDPVDELVDRFDQSDDLIFSICTKESMKDNEFYYFSCSLGNDSVHFRFPKSDAFEVTSEVTRKFKLVTANGEEKYYEVSHVYQNNSSVHRAVSSLFKGKTFEQRFVIIRPDSLTAAFFEKKINMDIGWNEIIQGKQFIVVNIMTN